MCRDLRTRSSDHARQPLLSLQHLGRTGYERLIDTRMELARCLRDCLESSGLVALSGATDTNIVCFRRALDFGVSVRSGLTRHFAKWQIVKLVDGAASFQLKGVLHARV